MSLTSLNYVVYIIGIGIKNTKGLITIKIHNENTPIQIYWKYHTQTCKFSDNNSDIYHISAHNIDCGTR